MKISYNILLFGSKMFLIIILFSVNNSFSQWYEQESGTNLSFKSVSFSDLKNGWIVGESGIILRTSDSGFTWTTQQSNTHSYLQSVSFCDSLNGWATGENGTILHTIDGGKIWEKVNHDTSYKVNHFKVQCINPTIVLIIKYTHTDDWITDLKLWKSIDSGKTWIDIYPSPNSSVVDFFFVNDSLGFTCGYGSNENGHFSYQISRTKDGGGSWKTYNFCEFGPFRVTNIYFENTQNGWATSWDSLYYTSNGGDTWNAVSAPNFNDLTDLVMFDSIGYVSRHVGKIKKTTDAGKTWIEQNSAPDYWIEDIEFLNPDVGWAVGNNGQIFHTMNGGITSVNTKYGETNTSNAVPTLYSIYPNPFNSTAIISYYLPVENYVEISILNILGQKIKMLASGMQEKGKHEIHLTGNNLSSGIYFYELKTDNFIERKKFILLQ